MAAESESRYGIGQAKLPPPPAATCVSEAEYDEAMMGSGCDCSCEGYARGPDRRCRVVCGLPYYGCWAPDPTDAEIQDAALASYADTLAGLPPEVRASVEAELAALTATEEWRLNTRGGLMLQRADAWDRARRCTAE